VAAAIACAQLERLPEILAARRQIFAGYQSRLEGIPGLGFQPVAEWAVPAPWMFCLTVDAEAFGQTRDRLAADLDAQGIETRPFFHPLHTLPPYADRPRPDLQVTERLAVSGLNLPTYVGLRDEDLDRIADAVRRSFRGLGVR
jgi:perosamine synthetase